MSSVVELSPKETTYVRTSMDRCDAEGLSRELGRAKNTIEKKLIEIKESERIRNMC